MKLSKCHFFTKEIQYLGHILSTKGIRPLPSKLQAIKTCIHQRCPNKYVHSLVSWDTYRKFIRNFAKTAKPDTVNPSASKIWVDTSPLQCFFSTQGISHPSTNITISQSKEMLHSLYRCIRWCLWSTATSRTWWNRIPNSFPLTHFHWHSVEMEHHRTRNLQCILCSH